MLENFIYMSFNENNLETFYNRTQSNNYQPSKPKEEPKEEIKIKTENYQIDLLGKCEKTFLWIFLIGLLFVFHNIFINFVVENNE